ncbi:MAG: DNA primase [Eubacteriales bacterium]|nr:DNA primase [Eubacteriales bacterium]
MGFSYAKSSIEELKSRVDIVDVIGGVVKLKRAGSSFKGLCPFHNEKTPSFSVSPSRQSFMCFGCGARGDVIEFVMRYYNMEFGEAVEKLASDYGITLERSSAGVDKKLQRLYEVNRLAAMYFYKALTGSPNPGYAYMKNRGMDPATMKKFGVGYADHDWQSLHNYMRSKGVSDDELIEVGLLSKSNGRTYDKFRDRVIFPIINTSKKVIGFGGRAILKDQSPKYLNSPESRVFQKKNNLYGLQIARQGAASMGYIILVEGYMDAVSLHQYGINNACASLGTALTENQAKLLHRYTKEVVLSYDADNAGRKAALRGIEILRNEGMKVKVLHVTSGKDPDEFVKEYGKDAFLKLIDGALSYGDYKLDSAKRGLDLNNDDDKIEYLKKAAEIIAGMDAAEREVYIDKVSRDMGVSAGAIREEVAGFRSGGRQTVQPARSRDEDRQARKFAMTDREKSLVKLALLDNQYVGRIAKYPDMLETTTAIDFFNACVAQMKAGGRLDGHTLLDTIEPEESDEVRRAYAQAAINEDDLDTFFNDCVNQWEIERLEKKVNEITEDIRIAEEEGEDEAAGKLSMELMDINLKLTERKRR